MARARSRRVDDASRSFQSSPNCRIVVVKRRRRGGAILPQSQWSRFERCDNRKLRAHNRRQCRGRKKQFVKCR